jgi:hypothetical protein
MSGGILVRLTTRLRLVLDWFCHEPAEYIDLRAFWREHTRDQAIDRAPDDHFSKAYQQAVRERIIHGRKPEKPLVYARPQLAQFAGRKN